jgi:RNA polymerase sigma-70 factor, ECF subfamily
MLPAYRLAYGMLRDRAEAEDAVQEAALRAWQHRRSFHAGAQLRPWFFAIVANQCRSARRGRWWSVLRLAEPDRLLGHQADEETTLDLRRALARIGYDERLVLVLRYYMDLGYEEVALTLGISEQAARSRTHRAVRRLRPQLVVLEEPLA